MGNDLIYNDSSRALMNASIHVESSIELKEISIIYAQIFKLALKLMRFDKIYQSK